MEGHVLVVRLYPLQILHDAGPNGLNGFEQCLAETELFPAKAAEISEYGSPIISRHTRTGAKNYALMNANRSGLTTSAWVVSIPCGNPL